MIEVGRMHLKCRNNNRYHINKCIFNKAFNIYSITYCTNMLPHKFISTMNYVTRYKTRLMERTNGYEISLNIIIIYSFSIYASVIVINFSSLNLQNWNFEPLTVCAFQRNKRLVLTRTSVIPFLSIKNN